MSKVLGSLMMTVMGVMLIGIIHNPKTMVVGLVLLAISQSLMFYAGVSQNKKDHTDA